MAGKGACPKGSNSRAFSTRLGGVSGFDLMALLMELRFFSEAM